MDATWISIALVGGWFLILLTYFIVCQFRLRPQTGSLDWIHRYPTKSRHPSATLDPMPFGEGCYMVGLAILSTCSRLFTQSSLLEYWGQANLVEVLYTVGEYVFLPVVAFCAIYWLVHNLFHGLFLSIYGVILMGLNYLFPIGDLAVATVVMVLMVKVLFQETDRSRWNHVPIFILISMVLAVATYFSPSLFFLYAPIILLVFAYAYRLFTHGQGFFAPLLSALLLLTTAYVATTILIYIPTGVVNQLTALQWEFYQLVLERWTNSLVYTLSTPWLVYGAIQLLLCWSYYMLALFLLVSTTIFWAKNRDKTTWFLLLLGLSSWLLFLFVGVDIILLPTILSLCHLLGQLKKSRRTVLVIFGTILGIITILSTFLAY